MYYKSIERLTGLRYQRSTSPHPTACKLYCWKPQGKELVRQEHSPIHQKQKETKDYIYV